MQSIAVYINLIFVIVLLHSADVNAQALNEYSGAEYIPSESDDHGLKMDVPVNQEQHIR